MKRGAHAAAWVGLALAAFLLWPQRWGGTMTYDVTHGTSMQPTFHTGDLAVLRKAGSYDVGDVAAYRSPSLHTTVMHRIKAKSAKGYTFQGDNNSFVDPDTVSDRDMLGKLLFRVPKAGLLLAWLLRPLNLALIMGALVLLISDRRDRQPTLPAVPSGYVLAPAPTPQETPPAVVVRIMALRLPADLPTADLEDAADLARLAQLHGIAILRSAEADFLLQGGMLFRYDRQQDVVRSHDDQARQSTRRRSPHGRDWDYGRAAVGQLIQLDTRRRA